ncbi:MAG: hypothetical protein WCX17_00300 [Parcubacteria group bacterium]|jgi:hypothetical protein
MPQGKHVLRLEQALRLWEDFCFILRTYWEAFPQFKNKIPRAIEGPLLHAPEFRDHLMQSLNGPFDQDRFSGSIGTWSELLHLGSLPPDLFAWTRHSRRVFHVPADLQTILSATSLKGTDWEDIDWPLRSFGIELGEPLTDEKGNEFDFLLVSNISDCIPDLEGNDFISISAFSKKLDEYRMLSKEDMGVIPKMIRKRGYPYMEKLFHKINTMGIAYMDSFFTVFEKSDQSSTPVDTPLTESFKDFHQRLEVFGAERGIDLAASSTDTEDKFMRYSILEKARHLAISFCQYLNTLPSLHYSRPEKWKSIIGDKINNKKAITHSSQLFVLDLTNYLDRRDRQLAEMIRHSRKGGGGEKCFHFRSGTFRKRPGQGRILEAPKCVRVKPSIVHKEKLLPGTLPLGAKTVIL